MASENFTGSEIEQAIVSGLYRSYGQDIPLTTEIILEELQNTRPLSVVMAEKINALREWAATRTIPAN
jgi:hypothetical protein